MVVEHLRFVLEHPRLTSKDVGIEVTVALFLQTADEVADSEDDSSDTQNSSSNTANDGSSRDVRAGAGDVPTVTRGRRGRCGRSE